MDCFDKIEPGDPSSRSCRSTRNQRGLTLVEILISVAILSAGTVVVMQALAQGAYVLKVATNRMWAYTFSKSKMADLEMSLKQGLELKTRGTFRMGHEQFRWEIDTSPMEEPALELVTLTVAWRQGAHDYASRFSTVARVLEEEDGL